MEEDSFKKQVSDLEAEKRALTEELEDLRVKRNAERTREARLARLEKDIENLKREKVELEGRRYDDDDGDG